MPQEFQVLRCVVCEKYQVHHTKKAKKWMCKVCGEKQSYIKIYYTGPAKACRTIVQQANYQEGEKHIVQILKESPYNEFENFRLEEKSESEDDLLSDNLDLFENEVLNSENFTFMKNVSSYTRNRSDLVEDPTSKLEIVPEYLNSSLEQNYVSSNKDFTQNAGIETKLFSQINMETNFTGTTSALKRKSSFNKNTAFKKILKAAENLK